MENAWQDKLYGDSGNGRICCGPGNDILDGGSSNILTSGLVEDLFICVTGNDHVTDFNFTQKDKNPIKYCTYIQ